MNTSIIGQSDPHPEPVQAPVPKPESAPLPTTDAIPVADSGAREGLDPTRYGDWEKNGRCIDF
ncbi:MAG: succinate dehydrogenase assembly factor 4 [Thermomonas sp.]